MKKVYRTLIRIVIFALLYFPLFTIPFYTGLNYLTPVIVIISFFLSKPASKYIVSKYFQKLIEEE